LRRADQLLDRPGCGGVDDVDGLQARICDHLSINEDAEILETHKGFFLTESGWT
jgi:hypothetical protein